jgi:hypothetical protein
MLCLSNRNHPNGEADFCHHHPNQTPTAAILTNSPGFKGRQLNTKRVALLTGSAKKSTGNAQ